jgi:hypothetical protein
MENKKSIAVARWYRLIPVVFITYSLAYLDRANFGFGAAGGMAVDLHITSTMSSLMGSLFFLGYFFFQIPGTIYASNKSAKKLIFWSLILWGLFAMATGLINHVKILLVIRFMLGVFESAVFPSMLVLISRWFTREERSRANTLLMFGNPVTILWMSIISGYLIHALGWRWMFIWEGIPAIAWAFFWWKLVSDKPMEVSWLNTDEKKTLADLLQKEQQTIKPVKNYATAFKSKLVILLCLLYLRICDLATFYHTRGSRHWNCKNRLAFSRTLPDVHNCHDRCFLFFRQIVKQKNIHLAMFSPGSNCFLLPVFRWIESFLDVLFPAKHSGSFHVCALWSFLRPHDRNITSQYRRRSHRFNQQLWRTGCFRRFLPGRLFKWNYG